MQLPNASWQGHWSNMYVANHEYNGRLALSQSSAMGRPTIRMGCNWLQSRFAASWTPPFYGVGPPLPSSIIDCDTRKSIRWNEGSKLDDRYYQHPIDRSIDPQPHLLPCGRNWIYSGNWGKPLTLMPLLLKMPPWDPSHQLLSPWTMIDRWPLHPWSCKRYQSWNWKESSWTSLL